MARYRIVTTPLRSAEDIATALREMGLRDVEVHAQPAPLLDWIGRPTQIVANVVVRKQGLGASSDDLGFVRNEDGTFDALLSEIHLFRFDRKWFAELARRCGAEMKGASEGPIRHVTPAVAFPKAPLAAPRKATSPAPEAVRRALGGETAPIARAPESARARAGQPDVVSPPAASLASISSNRVRADAASYLARFETSQKPRRLGCVLFFAPPVLWLWFSMAQGRMLDVSALIVLWTVWAFFYLVVFGILMARRGQHIVREFARAFPDQSKARAAALEWLASEAENQRGNADKRAKQFLAALARARAR